MSNHSILYIGAPQAGQSLAQAAAHRDSYVYTPTHLMQALGIYITYMPQVVVIDMAVDYAPAAYDHLRSVDAQPLILLTDAYVRSAAVHALPRGIAPEDLLAAIQHAVLPYVPHGSFPVTALGAKTAKPRSIIPPARKKPAKPCSNTSSK